MAFRHPVLFLLIWSICTFINFGYLIPNTNGPKIGIWAAGVFVMAAPLVTVSGFIKIIEDAGYCVARCD